MTSTEFAAAARAAACGAAGEDTTFAAWLIRSGQAFFAATGVYPLDITELHWRHKFTLNLAADTAARMALRETPLITTEDGCLACPACGTVDQIIEQDSAVRYNRLSLDTDCGRIFAALGDGDWHGDRVLCGHCETTLRLPRPIEDWT